MCTHDVHTRACCFTRPQVTRAPFLHLEGSKHWLCCLPRAPGQRLLGRTQPPLSPPAPTAPPLPPPEPKNYPGRSQSGPQCSLKAGAPVYTSACSSCLLLSSPTITRSVPSGGCPRGMRAFKEQSVAWVRVRVRVSAGFGSCSKRLSGPAPGSYLDLGSREDWQVSFLLSLNSSQEREEAKPCASLPALRPPATATTCSRSPLGFSTVPPPEEPDSPFPSASFCWVNAERIHILQSRHWWQD